jgi:DNA repair protein RadC
MPSLRIDPSSYRDFRAPTSQNASIPVESLSDEQLLLRLLGGAKDATTKEVALRLLDLAGSIEGMARHSSRFLAEEVGLGRAKAARLEAAFEIGRRRWAESKLGCPMASVDAVVAWARPRLLLLDHEEVWLLSLDGRNMMRNSRRIAQGGLHSCALMARDVLRPALRDGASSIILVHNHPSGDPSPSEADVWMTSEVDTACAAVGLALLDHVVVASSGSASLLDLGVVKAT